MQSKKECLHVKLMAEREASLFRQQLLALRQALARAQADNTWLREQQNKQVPRPQTSSSLSLHTVCKAQHGHA